MTTQVNSRARISAQRFSATATLRASRRRRRGAGRGRCPKPRGPAAEPRALAGLSASHGRLRRRGPAHRRARGRAAAVRRRGLAHRDPATPMSSRRMAALRALVASRLAVTAAFAPRPGLRALPFGGPAQSPRAALHASAPRPVARVAVVSGRAGRGEEGRGAEVGLPALPVPAGGPCAPPPPPPSR